MENPFYAAGLRFACSRCSACCRYESGFVYLSQKDLSLLASECQMDYTDFVKAYCRWVPFPARNGEPGGGKGRECLSLKEKSNYDCIFWKTGCTVYNARPLQCRTFPFWPEVVRSSDAWETAGLGCPGIGKGILYSREQIAACLSQRAGDPLVYREAGTSV